MNEETVIRELKRITKKSMRLEEELAGLTLDIIDLQDFIVERQQKVLK